MSSAVVQTCLDVFAKLRGQTGEQWVCAFRVSENPLADQGKGEHRALINVCWGDQQRRGQDRDTQLSLKPQSKGQLCL